MIRALLLRTALKRVSRAQVRSVSAGALSAVADGLRAAADASTRAANVLRPRADAPRDDADAGPQAEPRGESRAAPKRSSTAASSAGAPAAADLTGGSDDGPDSVTLEPPDFDDDGVSRLPESHIAELAAKPADEVVSLVQDLSTDDLRALFEYEKAHKRRKTVLAAIERAAAPPSRLVHTTGP